MIAYKRKCTEAQNHPTSRESRACVRVHAHSSYASFGQEKLAKENLSVVSSAARVEPFVAKVSAIFSFSILTIYRHHLGIPLTRLAQRVVC